MWVEEGDFSVPFDFGGNGETLVWMHEVLYYLMEAFEVKMMSSVFRGSQSIACSVFNI